MNITLHNANNNDTLLTDLEIPDLTTHFPNDDTVDKVTSELVNKIESTVQDTLDNLGKNLDDEMKTFYHRLRAKGKPFKVAIVACMRKLVIAMNTVVKEQRLWLNQT